MITSSYIFNFTLVYDVIDSDLTLSQFTTKANAFSHDLCLLVNLDVFFVNCEVII